MSTGFDLWASSVDQLLAKEGFGVTHLAFEPADLDAAYSAGWLPMQFVAAVRSGTVSPKGGMPTGPAPPPDPQLPAVPLSDPLKLVDVGVPPPTINLAAGWLRSAATLIVIGGVGLVVVSVVALFGPDEQLKAGGFVYLGAGLGLLTSAAWIYLALGAVGLLAEIAVRIGRRED